MGHSNVWNSHPKKYGPGSRTCENRSILQIISHKKRVGFPKGGITKYRYICDNFPK
ncbi:hypothetical protein AMTRI_Chr12g238350 [Amborella trichopoda]